MADNNDKEVKPEAEKQQGQNEEKKRSVVISADVAVTFKCDGKDDETVMCRRDVFSVMDAVMSRMQGISKEEFDKTTVTVNSVEDEAKSEPPKDGEPRWKGPYGVGGAVVDGLKIPDAMKALTQALIPNDSAMKGVERLAEQLFLRSRLDGFVFIGSFDGQPAVVPLLSSFRDQKAECFEVLYKQMHLQAENLRAYATKMFPEIASKVNWGVEPQRKASGLVLPDGRPVEVRSRPRVPGLGCGGKPGNGKCDLKVK